MSVIFFLVAIGIIVAGGFLAAFIWSVRSGQYDDDYTPSVRMLFDNFNSGDDPEENSDDADTTSENSDNNSNKEEAQTEKSNNNKS